MKKKITKQSRTGLSSRILRSKAWKLGRWIVLLFVLFGIGTVAYSLRDLPNPMILDDSTEFPESSLIYDRNGELLYEMYEEKNRVPVALKDVPENLVKATLAVEDAKFYKHFGFDFKGIARGLYRTLFKKRLQGGSTITQQLVKNALLSQQRTWTRKAREAVLTIATEVLYTKDQILEMYFNQTPYGGTMYGVRAAAKGIFGKEPKDLSIAEAALIAGLPGSPTKYSPFSNPTAAKARQELVLERMKEMGYLTSEEKEKIAKEPLSYNLSGQQIKAPHFVLYVREKLIEKYGSERVLKGGLKITTTLDLGIQGIAEAEVASETAKLAKNKVSNGASLITQPKTGEILAMVGSKDYWSTEIDGKYNITTALRQPGSSIKPVNYAVAIDQGKATAASVFADQKTCFEVENQKPYCPTNYGNRFFGVQTLRNSLGNSLNIPAVKTLKINGLETFISSASAFGIDTFKDPSNYGLSLTLGGGEVTMMAMNTAFGVFANSGLRQDLVSILKVTDNQGVVLEEFKPTLGKRVLSKEASFVIQDILSDDGARSMVFGRGSMLVIKGHPEVAVKTGTTNDMRDNWTIGFTPDYVVSVWVGNNDNSKMGSLVSGTTGAAPIWNKIMTKILAEESVKKWVKPENVVSMRVCNLTGGAVPEEGCDNHYEYIDKRYAPSILPIEKANVLIDKDSGQVVKESDNKPNTEYQEKTMITDVMGDKYCLDCPRNDQLSPTPTP